MLEGLSLFQQKALSPGLGPTLLSMLQHQELAESDSDSCVEPTMLPITLRKTAMNSMPNGECNRVQMDDAITDVDRVWIAETNEATATLPTYTNKKWRQLQREDDILKRVIYYRDQGRIPTAAERKEERRDVVRLLCERVIIERNGLLYHKLDFPDNCQLLLPYSQRARVLMMWVIRVFQGRKPWYVSDVTG